MSAEVRLSHRHLARAASLLLLIAMPLASRADNDPRRCTGMTDDAARLACYDQAFAVAPVAETAPATSAPRAEAPVATPPSAPPPSGTIESRLAGRIDHWQHGMPLKLENGQVWLCQSEGRDAFAPLDNPKVVIKRNFLGHYFMRIDGLARQISVLPAP